MEKEIKVTGLYYDYVLGAKYDAIVEVGGRYSGKSYNSQIEETANLGSKKDYKLLIIQELDKGSSDGYYAGLVDKIEQFGHTPAYNITGSSTKITNKINGNQVLFRGYKTEQQKKDVKNIDQVTKIIVEEGEWMTYDDFLALIQQLRGKVKEDRRIDILLNPVNPECFVNSELIEKTPDKVFEYFPNSKRPKVFEHSIVTDYEADGKKKTATIRILIVLSTHYDNPHLNPQQRASIEIYRNTDPDKYAQLGQAKFIRSGDTFFKEFDKDIHVIDDFEIPDGWYVYTTMDYGLDMLAGYKVAFDYRGDMYIAGEMHKPDQIISEAARAMKQLTIHTNTELNYGPPDLMKRQQTDGKTTWDLFAEDGWFLAKTSNDREIGSLAMKEWFKVFDRKMEDGTVKRDSRIHIFKSCTNLIACLPRLVADKRNINRYATLTSELERPIPNYHSFTHGPDAIRYICVSHNATPIKPHEKTMKEQFFGKEKQSWSDTWEVGDIY